MRAIVFVFLIVTLSCAADLSDSLPNKSLTPGSSDPKVTLNDICIDVGSKPAPKITYDTKKWVLKRYKIPANKWSEYAVVRLIPLDLGGGSNVRNLWPQKINSTWNSKKKKALTDQLVHLVCFGQITLKDARKEITGNWIEAYKKYVESVK
jgi:hypothetical protein